MRTASDTSTASLDVRWDLGQGRMWSYHTEAGLHRAAGGDGPAWALAWAPTVVHPQLATRQHLALSTTPAEPAPVVDRSGVPLLAPTPVVSVLLDRLQTGDLPKVTGALAKALSPIEPSITPADDHRRRGAHTDGRAYTVAVLRETDYQTVKNAIHDLPGVRFTTSERLLAPDAGFARQVLPAVRTGLAAQLDGVPGWSVAVVDAAGGTVASLAEEAPKPGSTVAVALDRTLQAAAEDAVEPLPQQAMLVAIQPSTGNLVAVAQNGAADAAGALALTGRFPPGSTFKIVTALAGIEQAGLRADTPSPARARRSSAAGRCPTRTGSTSAPFRLPARSPSSCNTTFATSARASRPDGLTRRRCSSAWAPTSPFHADHDHRYRAGRAGPGAARGRRFGQGQVLASPLGMALVAATVAHGSPVVPQLLPGRATEVIKPATARTRPR